jgi:hypothetical protein
MRLAEPRIPDVAASPEVRSDIYYGDLSLTRREAIVASIAGIAMVGLGVFALFALPTSFARFSLISTGLGGLALSRRSIRTWKAFRAAGGQDRDLIGDRRLEGEDRRAPAMTALDRGLRALQFVTLAASLFIIATAVAGLLRTRVDARTAPRSSFEFVDVVMVNGPADWPTATTVDITGDRVTKIGPYSQNSTSGIRSFEAMGKYLVAGRLDLSKPNPLERFQQGWTRPIDIETRGDFVLFDVDPRLRDVSIDHVVGAIIAGEYWSRTQLAARLKR